MDFLFLATMAIAGLLAWAGVDIIGRIAKRVKGRE